MSSFLPATTESIAQALEAKDPSESISILYRVLGDPSSSPEAGASLGKGKECPSLGPPKNWGLNFFYLGAHFYYLLMTSKYSETALSRSSAHERTSHHKSHRPAQAREQGRGSAQSSHSVEAILFLDSQGKNCKDC
ncbi:hypothetical protein TSUD_424050, partial [Trifolium subterraneum]